MPKRLVIRGPRQAEFEDVSVPECPPNGLLVRARTTAISTGTELRVYRGIPVDPEGRFLFPNQPLEFPVENGYSMVGDVIEVGSSVNKFEKGDRVFVPEPHKQVAACRANQATRIPEVLPDDVGPFLHIFEVAHIALRRGQPSPGENVAIVGAGLIGLSALAYGKAFGLRTAVVDIDPSRLKVAASMGADWTGSPEDPGFEERAVDFFDGEGADLVLEAASTWAAIETGLRIARPEARVVVVARHTDQPAFSAVGYPYLAKNLSIRTSYGHPPPGTRWDRKRSLSLTLDLLVRARLNVRPIITHRFDWQELPDVYRRMDASAPEMIGVAIDWSDRTQESPEQSGADDGRAP